MPRNNQVKTVKLPLSLDVNTDAVLSRLSVLGLFGKNKAEVASTIINRWIWDNYDMVEKHGAPLSITAKKLNQVGDRKRGS